MRFPNKYYKLEPEAADRTLFEDMAPYILVVEDNPDIRSAVALLLESMGCVVATSENGQNALHRLHESERLPDLILLDLLMPVMDGWRFLQEKSKRFEWQAIPTVVLSAVADSDFSAQAANVTEWVLKPLNYQQLEEIVVRNCRGTPTRH
jgi:CheY-like chemotaxis protein